MSSRMGLQLLETLTSALYEDPIVFFREYVQNSVDAFTDVNRISSVVLNDDFFVDIAVDDTLRNIRITDNGFGISESEFHDTMTGIGKSKKRGYIDQIGFRGIGRLSALPFCGSLKFINKLENSDTILTCIWDGTKYQNLLKSKGEQELEEAIGKITMFTVEKYSGNAKDHFFRVEICEYHDEISELINSDDFIYRLTTILPLKYSPEFSYQQEIKEKYLSYLGVSLDDCSFNVRYQGNLLYKPYINNNILESGIHFVNIQFRRRSQTIPPDRIGVLWFTFDRRVSSVGKEKLDPFGIFVRSKNMLIGNQYSLADAVTKSSADYVSTYRELAQTLKGVYGEMLLYTDKLGDNARRDWFKIDSSSVELRSIIADFLRRLINYRYAASKAFNNKESKKLRDNLVQCYTDLTQASLGDDHIKDFYEKAPEKEERVFEFADDDIPRSSITYKKIYDQLLSYIKAYFLEKDELDEFIKVRTYIKKAHGEEESK